MGVAGLILFSYAILWPFVSIFFCCCNNYHKLSALRKSKLIVLHFWRAEVQNASHWSRFKMLARLTASRGSRGKVILCLFQFLEASSIPWLVAASCHFLPPSSQDLLSEFRLLLPSCKDPCDYIRATCLTLANLLSQYSKFTHTCYIPFAI